jgi:hypothetical protein
MIFGDDLRILDNYRTIFKKLCNGIQMTVVTDTIQEPEEIFGNYAKVFNLYIKRGDLRIITIAEAEADDLDMENFFFL